MSILRTCMKLDEQNMYRQQTYRDKLNGGDVNKMLPLIQQPSSDIIKFYNFICISKNHLTCFIQ